MAGFFPHTGQAEDAQRGYTALPMTTFATILDDIVADIGAGVNGWTLVDDQRTLAGHGGIYAIPCAYGGAAYQVSAVVGFTVAAASAALAASAGARLKANFAPGWTEIMSNGSPYYPAWTQVTAVASDTSCTTAVVSSAGTNNIKSIVEKAAGYIVLKHTSAQRTFYVMVIRPRSYGDALRVQVWASWDSVTHTGTSPSNQEILRAYSVQKTADQKLQYVLWLLPDTFTLWAGADPSNAVGTNFWDLAYAGNCIAYRQGDSDCLAFACTNTQVSAYGAPTNLTLTGTNQAAGGVQMYKSLAGSTWLSNQVSPTNTANQYQVCPRGSAYIDDTSRAFLDDSGQVQVTALDLYQAPQPLANSMNEGKRGTMRHIRVPVGWPSGLNLVTLGPADDGLTYLLVRCSLPFPVHALGQTTDGDNSPMQSAFAMGNRSGTQGEITMSSQTPIVIRWFLMPVGV